MSVDKDKSPGKRNDPFPAYCFKVVLERMPPNYDNATAFFSSVGGLKYETEVTDYKEGGENRRVHKLVGTTKWSNLVLKRGFCKGFVLASWLHNWVHGEGTLERVTGRIYQLDTTLAEVCHWTFKEGWPCKWELSQFDASKSELSIETLEIAHNGLHFNGASLSTAVEKCHVINTQRPPSESVVAYYNPTEITIKKSVPWNKHKSAKGNSPMLEYTNGENRVLSVELLFDASLLSGSGGSIRREIEKLEAMTLAPEGGGLMSAETHPPLVLFKWEPDLRPIKGVVTSLTTKYTRFSSKGVPTRATCSIEIKEVDEVQAAQQGGTG